MDNEQIDNGSVRLKYGIFFWDYGSVSHNPEESLSLFDLFLFSHRCVVERRMDMDQVRTPFPHLLFRYLWDYRVGLKHTL